MNDDFFFWQIVPCPNCMQKCTSSNNLSHTDMATMMAYIGFVADRKNNKSGAERGAKGDSHPGPRTVVNTMSMSRKKIKVARHFKLSNSGIVVLA